MSSKTEPSQPDSLLPRPTRSWSLATRLTLWYAATAFTLLLIATGYLYWALARNLDREDDQFLADKVRIVRAVLNSRSGDLVSMRQEADWAWSSAEPAQIYFRVLDDAGGIVIESPGMGELFPPAAFPQVADIDASDRANARSPAGHPFRTMVARVPLGPERRSYTIQAAMDREHEGELLEDYRRQLSYVLGLSLIACVVFGYRIAKSGIRPVENIAATAERIRVTTLDERLTTVGLPAELARLADTFNGMLDRLEEAFARLAQFSADIAHELRTPINNLRGETEVALSKSRSPEEYREVLGSSLEEYARLSLMIDSLLFLARAERPETHIKRECVDVGKELVAVQEFYEAAASEADVELKVVAKDQLVAALDRGLFQRAVGNLVENALAHTQPGGKVTLSAEKKDHSIQVEVADTGCGVREEHLSRLFDRFYRVDRARSSKHGSVGLGLAIVKSIAELHGGAVHITSEVGRGTKVVLLLPCEPDAQAGAGES